MYNRGRSLREVGGLGNEWGIKSPGPFVHLRELKVVISNKDCAGEPAATSGFTMTGFFYFFYFLNIISVILGWGIFPFPLVNYAVSTHV